MPEISLYGEKLNITSQMIKEYKTLEDTITLAKAVSASVLKTYNACQSLDKVIKAFPAMKNQYYLIMAKFHLQALRDDDLIGYDYSAEDFLDDSKADCNAMDDIYYDLLAAYKRLNNQKVEAKRYRDMRKATRSRIVGGGFSILGAIEGMAIAGAFNTLTGAAHSLYNMADESFSDMDIRDQKWEIYKEARGRVAAAVFQDIIGMLYFRYAKIGYTPFYLYDDKRARNIKKAIDDGEVPENRIPREVAKVLYHMPYNDKLYFWAFDQVGVDFANNDDGGLWDYAKLFDKDYVVQTKTMFLRNADAIYNKYIGNQFYKLFTKSPGMTFLETATRMYEQAMEDHHVSSIYLQGSPEFSGSRAACLRHLNAFDYSFEDDESCFLIYHPAENFYIALTEYHIYVTYPKHMSTLWDDIESFKVEDEAIIANGPSIRMTLLANEDADLFVDMAEIFLLKKRYLLGVKDNSAKQHEKRERDAEFIGKIIREMKELSTRFPFSSYVYYYGTGHDNKFRCAEAHYVYPRNDEFPLVCYDATVLGNAEDGFYVTTKGIHLHNDGMRWEKFFPWKNLRIRSSGDGTVIYLNDEAAYISGGLSDKTRPLVSMLLHLRSQYQDMQPSSEHPVSSQYPQSSREQSSGISALALAGIVGMMGVPSSPTQTPRTLKNINQTHEVNKRRRKLHVVNSTNVTDDSIEQTYTESSTVTNNDEKESTSVETGEMLVEWYNNGVAADNCQDFDSALSWYLKAANAGYSEAMFMLGTMCLEGRGVQKDIVIGKQWLQQAAATGHALAQKRLDNIVKAARKRVHITDYVDYLKSFGTFDNVYFNENKEKSQKKIQGAIKGYAKLSSNEIPIVCFDDTVFGAADEGFLMTNKFLYAKSRNDDGYKIKLKFIDAFILIEDGSTIMVLYSNKMYNIKLSTTLCSETRKLGEFIAGIHMDIINKYTIIA